MAELSKRLKSQVEARMDDKDKDEVRLLDEALRASGHPDHTPRDPAYLISSRRGA